MTGLRHPIPLSKPSASGVTIAHQAETCQRDANAFNHQGHEKSPADGHRGNGMAQIRSGVPIIRAIRHGSLGLWSDGARIGPVQQHGEHPVDLRGLGSGIMPPMLYIEPSLCRACPTCGARQACRTRAIVQIEHGDRPVVESSRCLGCMSCVVACPFGAVGNLANRITRQRAGGSAG